MAESAGLLFKIRADGDQAKREMREVSGIAKTDLGSSLSGLAGPAAIAATAIAAIGTVAVGVAAKLFDITTRAAEFGSQIKDASDKTGLSAQTLLALKTAAEQSGSSFEAITASVSKFNVLLGEAKTGNEKAQKTLEQYGITAKDVNGAFAQAIKVIAEETDVTKQAAAAKALFKDRASEILPVIKSFNGDLPGLIKHLKDLGITMSDEDAEAADKFGDSMGIVKAQLQSVGFTIGKEFMPMFLDLANRISKWVAQNKGEIEGWARSISNGIRGVIQMFQDWYNWIADHMDTFRLISGILSFGLSEEIRNQLLNIAGTLQKVGASKIGPGAPSETTGGGAGFAESEQDIKAREAEVEKRRKEREREAQERIASAEKSNRSFLAAERERFAAEQENYERTLLNEGKLAEYRDKSYQNIKRYLLETTRLIENAYQVDLQQAKNEDDRKAAAAERTRALIALERETNKEAADAITNIEAQRKKTDEARIKRLEQMRDLTHAMFELETESYILALKEEEARQASLTSLSQHAEIFRTVIDSILGGAEAPVPEETIFDKWTGSFKEFYDTVMNFVPEIQDVLMHMANVLTDAYGQFANALGSVVQQWILTGETGPAVMRKILASALATIAAEAAVRAIWELALGFASLFFNPAEAAAHFTAAALFGSIAVVAGLAGRAVAGNAFKQQTQGRTATGANTQGSRSTGAGAYSSQEPGVWESGINRPENRGITLVIKDKSSLGQTLAFEVEKAGPLRNAIIRTAQA